MEEKQYTLAGLVQAYKKGYSDRADGKLPFDGNDVQDWETWLKKTLFPNGTHDEEANE